MVTRKELCEKCRHPKNKHTEIGGCLVKIRRSPTKFCACPYYYKGN